MTSSEISPDARKARGAKAAAAATAPDPLRWWALAVIALAQLVVLLDGTIVNIALPSAQADLRMGDGSRQWVISAYALALGGLLLLGGFLVDAVGRRRAFVLGLLGFAAASAAGGSASEPAVLFAARAGQGAFAALLAPATLSLVMTTFTDPRERRRAFAVFGTVSGIGSALGLILGGLLTEYLNWRWCMYINVPLALGAALAGMRVLRPGGGGRTVRLDVIGVLLGCSGLTAVVHGFGAAEQHGWSSPGVLGVLAAGGLLVALFAVRQRRVSHPLVPPRIVGDRQRAGALGVAALGHAATFGLLLFLTYYLQAVLGYSAVAAGAAFLPLTVGMTAGVTLATRLAGRLAPGTVIVPGLLLAASGVVLLTRLDPGSAYVSQALPALLPAGFGLGCASMTAMTVATGGVAARDAGRAAALFTTAQQVGGAVGATVLNTVAVGAAGGHLAAHLSAAARVEAAVRQFTVALWAVAGVLLVAALLAAAVLCRPAAANGGVSRIAAAARPEG
ncbi:MFS transporter [Streptomyces sp. SudanB91_2054]|uniref:MFS transporter n=1 Tax=Streptomyces sp. SudanB91_2054 TaxID=3035278 RepID=UPI0036D8EDF7